MYDKLVAEVNNIDISGFVLKNKYDTDKLELEKQIPDTRGYVKKTDCNAKNIIDIENRIPIISGLPTNAALTAVGNKMPDSNSLVKQKKERL